MRFMLGFVVTSVVTLVLVSASMLSAQGGMRYKGGGRYGMGGRGENTMMEMPGIRDNPLSQSQKERIARIRQDTRTRVRSIRTDNRLAASEKELRIRRAREEGHRRVISVLTDKQRREFDQWWSSRRDYGMGPHGMGGMQGMGRGPMRGMGPGMMHGDGRTNSDSPAGSNGKSVFQNSCVVCHGANGAKVAGWKSKVRAMSTEQVEQAIRRGAKGMPAFSKTLSAQQIQSAAGYAKELAASGR